VNKGTVCGKRPFVQHPVSDVQQLWSSSDRTAIMYLHQEPELCVDIDSDIQVRQLQLRLYGQ
jgi:hypothetical protein